MSRKVGNGVGRSLLIWWGSAHFLVDFACAALVVSIPALCRLDDTAYYPLVIAYNLVAFGSQPLWGWLLDHYHRHTAGAAAGVFVVGCGALALMSQPVAAVLLAGIGNALFHVGAGAIVYQAGPGRASGAGVFIAPGGLGLVAGILAGLRQAVDPLFLSALLLVCSLLLQRLSPQAPSRISPASEHAGPRQTQELLPVLLLITAVASRSFIGFALPVPWKADHGWMILLAVAAFAGKSVGGFIADRAGWRIASLAMLATSAFFATLYQSSLPAALLSIFCVQCTTGVTLSALQGAFPGRPAYAFGLPCLALLVGAAPFFFPKPIGNLPPGLVVAVCLFAAFALHRALTDHQEIYHAQVEHL